MAIVPVNADTVIPSDARLWYPRQKAIHAQIQLLDEWKPASEVWIVRRGKDLVSIPAAMCGMVINSMFRSKLHLREGNFVSAMACVIGPAAFANMIHDHLVTRSLMIYERRCSLCSELKASVLLNFSAVVTPLILSPLINIATAARLGTRVPAIYEYRKLGNFVMSALKPGRSHLAAMIVLNTLIASLVTFKQFACMENVANILIAMEQHREKQNVEKFHALE